MHFGSQEGNCRAPKGKCRTCLAQTQGIIWHYQLSEPSKKIKTPAQRKTLFEKWTKALTRESAKTKLTNVALLGLDGGIVSCQNQKRRRRGRLQTFPLFFGEKGNKNQPTKENKPMSTITILEFDIMESIKDLVWDADIEEEGTIHGIAVALAKLSKELQVWWSSKQDWFLACKFVSTRATFRWCFNSKWIPWTATTKAQVSCLHKVTKCSLRGSYQTVDLSRWMDWFIYRIEILLEKIRIVKLSKRIILLWAIAMKWHVICHSPSKAPFLCSCRCSLNLCTVPYVAWFVLQCTYSE
jgi:hypothetical protein